MKNFIKILSVATLTVVFVACGGAEVSFAPIAKADEPAGAAGQAVNGGSASCACEPGAKGDTGDQGPAGPQGAPGKDGTSAVCVNDLNSCPPGVPGAAGPAGPAGAQGPRGEAGLDGLDGKPGAQGPMGPAGQAGPQGPAGPAGPKGADGKNGLAITKGSLYTTSSGLVAADAIAYCEDENDIVLTGTCVGQGVLWGIIGPYLPTNPDFKSGWECKASNVGGNPVSATAVCLEVP